MTKENKTTEMTTTTAKAATAQTKPAEILDMPELSKRLEKTTSQIRKEIGNVTKSFCRIGFELWNAKESKLYLGQGFNNVTEYGEKVFGFKKSSISNYISICERFSVRKNDKPTAQLAPDFANFSYGQLSLMLSVPDDKLSEISPDATCKEIRESKKAEKEESSSAVAETDSSAAPPAQENAGLLYAKVLVKDDIALIIKLLRDNIGREITVTVEG